MGGCKFIFPSFQKYLILNLFITFPVFLKSMNLALPKQCCTQMYFPSIEWPNLLEKSLQKDFLSQSRYSEF